MCGIAGIVTHNCDVAPALDRAQRVQHHRGPDAQGYCQHQVADWQVALGHQRLAILDLTAGGNQPMASGDGNYWIIYNGEVYNYQEIRSELENLGHNFRSTSDTEVVLIAIQRWGPREALRKFNGMWALALLDQRTRRLILSRDRFGVKPLYYFFANNELYFASEIKTILEMSGEKFPLNYPVIGQYIQQCLLDTGNETFFEGIYKIPPGSYAEIDLSDANLILNFQSYWDLSTQETSVISEDSLVNKIRDLFCDSVRLRLRSDVPLGVLLSGGVDSSSIASIMQELLGRNVELNLLSAVSEDERFCQDLCFNESPFIEIMGHYLQQPVHKVIIDFKPEQAFSYLEEVCWLNDEPVGSFANVAQYLLMKRARDLGVTVVLSGQGADELLCGYMKYLGFYVQALVRQGKYLKALKLLAGFWRQGTILNQVTFAEAKRYLPPYLKAKGLEIKGDRLSGFSPLFLGMAKGMNLPERQAKDIKCFSIPVLTHYEDRMSMAWSREIRNPFLDYRLVQELVALPPEMKLRNGWTKYIFRRAMEPFLPREIVWRKDKQGFVNPQSEWLKKDLKQDVLFYFGQDSMMFHHRLINRSKLLKNFAIYCRQPVGQGTVSFKDIFNPIALEIWLRRFDRYIS
jgi:asparagine synthase (glutamine-hydrolysing)